MVQGQQAENLLDFDEPDSSTGGSGPTTSSGLASIIMGGGASSNPATAKILTSSNPLDELVSIFGNTNIGAASISPISGGGGSGAGMGSLAGIAAAQAQPRKPQDDLLDLF